MTAALATSSPVAPGLSVLSRPHVVGFVVVVVFMVVDCIVEVLIVVVVVIIPEVVVLDVCVVGVVTDVCVIVDEDGKTFVVVVVGGELDVKVGRVVLG